MHWKCLLLPFILISLTRFLSIWTIAINGITDLASSRNSEDINASAGQRTTACVDQTIKVPQTTNEEYNNAGSRVAISNSSYEDD
jgi:hypothetical protein